MLAVCIIVSANAYSQQEPEKFPERKAKLTTNEKGEQIPVPALSTLKLVYQPGNVYHYKYMDSTKVLRTYSDSSTLEYTRLVTYYLKQRAFKDAKSGDLEIETNIDSTEYKFISDDYALEYQSSNKKMQLQFPDLLAAIHPENRTFVTRYSPNWEVVDVFSPDIEYWRDYITKYGEGQDTMQKYIFLNSISLTNLSHIGDFQKGALPNGRVAKDSVWKKPYSIKIDGIDCKDDVASTRIVSVNSKETVIETISNSINSLPQSTRLYNINQFATLLGGKGKGKQTMHITRKGVCTESTIWFDVILQAQVNKEIFTESVKSRYSWKLTAQYEY